MNSPAGAGAIGFSRRGNLGFTLVEGLVVAVIMGILAAVSIPIYTGYIRSQRQQAAKSMAQTAAVTANGLYRRYNVNPNSDSLRAHLFVPNPGQFTFNVIDSFVVVTERSDSSDLVTDSAKYK